MTEIYIVSGFLGAGKTTLIQKMLKESFSDKKVVLLENDFGDISVDAAILNSKGIEVREINSGCICCSLSGDFTKELKALIEDFNPDVLIIEPSGVAKLSDILENCKNAGIEGVAEVKTKITVVDVKNYRKYLDNFGEFFEDQVKHGNVILLSDVEKYPERVESIVQEVQELNKKAKIYSDSWDSIKIEDILDCKNTKHEHIHSCNHDHNHHCNHEHGQNCNHEHHAEETFDTTTIYSSKVWTMEELKVTVDEMESNAKGNILRAKGIFHGKDGNFNIQYTNGELNVEQTDIDENFLCIIGEGLDESALKEIFCGEK